MQINLLVFAFGVVISTGLGLHLNEAIMYIGEFCLKSKIQPKSQSLHVYHIVRP
jgi:hypothetical protein